MTHQSREQQHNIGEQARNSADKAKAKAQETLESVSHETQQQARNVANTVQEKTKSTVNAQKEEAANQINGIASAFRETGSTLREQDNEWIAGYADNMAEQMERFAGYLHDGDINRFLSDARDLARSKPEIFLGGAFTLGLVAARFLKSSSPSRNQRYSRGYSYGERSDYGNYPRNRSYDRQPGRSGWDYSQEWAGESGYEARYESDYLGATEDHSRRPDPQTTAPLTPPSAETSRPISETTRTRPATSPAGTASTSTSSAATPGTTGSSATRSGQTGQSSGKDDNNGKNKENTK
jgi:vacuolar-type H+-ATPase subunit E/Vma4